MPIPKENNLRLPLLRVISDAGGELVMRKAIERVSTLFSDLTQEDKQLKLRSGKQNLFDNRVQWARQWLVLSGYLFREPRGLWRVTPQGKIFLEENWSAWEPNYSNRMSNKGKVIENAQSPKKVFAPSMNNFQEVPQPRRHEQIKELIRQIGEILGHFPETEFHETPYIYDVVWKNFAQALRPSLVFEVQDKGNLIEALAKLQHAKDSWGSRIFLTVTGDRDRKRIETLVAPLLSGTFHRLARDLVLLSPEQIEEVYETLNRNRDLIHKLLPE